MSHFNRATLHRAVITQDAHRLAMAEDLRAIADARPAPRPAATPFGSSVKIPLSTVSLNGNFDANIKVTYQGTANSDQLMVDSGNSVLILPYWENIAGLAAYRVIGEAQEPWGAPAKIVTGPIGIPTLDGSVLNIDDCVFYACSGDNANGARTANFGTGCLSPWSASGWATPAGVGVTLQAPLSYLRNYKCAVFDYVASTAAAARDVPVAEEGSSLLLYDALPPGFATFDVIPNLQWMSVRPAALSIGGTVTAWPSPNPAPIAMVDTGGGPVLVSDPARLICSTAWVPPGQDPQYMTAASLFCEFTAASLALTLTDGTTYDVYGINPTLLPPAARGLTAIICQKNEYLMGQNGLNTGGISALINFILIDYAHARVGFKAK